MCLRRRKHKPKVMDDSAKALANAKLNVRKVEARNPEVVALATSLREIRTRNHFSEQLMEIMAKSHGET